MAEPPHDTELDPPRGSLLLRGLVEADVAALFIEQLAALTSSDAPIRLDLEQARIDDPQIARMIAETIQQTVERIGEVEIIGAPSALRRALGR